MLEWRAVCAERCTYGSERRSREIVRLRPASYSTPHRQRLRVSGGDPRPVLATVIGWAISKHIDAELALSALRQAIATQEPPPGCIHHSERGVQYLCNVTVQSTPLLTQPDQVLRFFSSETTAPASFTFDNNCGEIRH